MYSTTQTANYTALAGLIVLALNHFGFLISDEQVLTVIAGLTTFTSICVSIYNRYKKGDVTIAGKYL